MLSAKQRLQGRTFGEAGRCSGSRNPARFLGGTQYDRMGSAASHAWHGACHGIYQPYRRIVLPLTWIQKTPTDKVRTQYALIFGNRRINLYLGSGITAGSCDKIIEKTRLSIGSRLMLPILLVRQTYQVQDAALMAGDAQQVGEAAAKRFWKHWRKR